MFLTKVIKKIETHILCPIIIFLANPVVCEIMWESMVESDRTHMTNNTMQENELCMLSEQGKNWDTHTQLIDRHCFYTTTMFTRTPLTVQLCFKYSTLPVYGLITRPGESYRPWRVVVCDQETSNTWRLKPATGL